MSPERPASSDESLVERFEAARAELARKQAQLEAAVGGFEDAEAFAESWHSDDPDERNRSEVVHSVFERSHQLLMDLASLLARVGDRHEALPEPAKRERLTARLCRGGVITRADADLIEDHVEIRNEGQHGYLGQTPHRVWDAAHRQLDAVPALQKKLTRWLREQT